MKYKKDPMATFKAINKVKLFNESEQLRLNLPVRIAYESIKSGKGIDDDFHTLAAAINVAMVCAEKIDPLVEDTAVRARDAMGRCLKRHKQLGVWGFDGLALQDVPVAIDLHEQLIDLYTPLQLQTAMKEVLRRMDAGQLHT